MEDYIVLWSTVLWQGFSLALIICILARGSVATNRGRTLAIADLSFSMRLLIGMFSMVGLFSAAATAGTPTGLTGAAIAATLIGIIGGIWVGFRLIRGRA